MADMCDLDHPCGHCGYVDCHCPSPSETHRQRDGLFPPECACGLPWPCPVAAQDLMLDDLAALLRALGLGDHARPETPHAVMLSAIAEVERLKAAVHSWSQADKGYQCAACYVLTHSLAPEKPALWGYDTEEGEIRGER